MVVAGFPASLWACAQSRFWACIAAAAAGGPGTNPALWRPCQPREQRHLACRTAAELSTALRRLRSGACSPGSLPPEGSAFYLGQCNTPQHGFF